MRQIKRLDQILVEKLYKILSLCTINVSWGVTKEPTPCLTCQMQSIMENTTSFLSVQQYTPLCFCLISIHPKLEADLNVPSFGSSLFLIAVKDPRAHKNAVLASLEENPRVVGDISNNETRWLITQFNSN